MQTEMTDQILNLKSEVSDYGLQILTVDFFKEKVKKGKERERERTRL